MKSEFKISIGALMVWILLLALQLVMFQGVWFIVLIPPMTMAALALNLGLLFLLVRPSALNTRIIGLLLGAIAAVFVTVLPITPKGIELAENLQVKVVNWISSQPDPEALVVRVLRFLSGDRIWIAFVSLDVIGVATIWAGGWLENWLRGRRAHAASPPLGGLPPIDDRAASPL